MNLGSDNSGWNVCVRKNAAVRLCGGLSRLGWTVLVSGANAHRSEVWCRPRKIGLHRGLVALRDRVEFFDRCFSSHFGPLSFFTPFLGRERSSCYFVNLVCRMDC